jgi:hypothetical protein
MFNVSDSVLISSFCGNVRPRSSISVLPAAIGKESNFRRQITEPNGVIENEILKLIRTNYVLTSLLRRLLLVKIARDELRTKLGCQD